MRFQLKATYVFLRACEADGTGSRLWVGWCPELDVQTQDYGLEASVWRLDRAVRDIIKEEVGRNRHPSRRMQEPPPDGSDADWSAYRDFVRSRDVDTGWRYGEWSHQHRLSQISDHVETCFAERTLWVHTMAGDCNIDCDSGWGPNIAYRTGRRLRVRVMCETEFDVNSADLKGSEPTLEDLRRLYGAEAVELLRWKILD